MRISTSFRSSAFALLACVVSFAPARAAWDPNGNRISFMPGSVTRHAAIPFRDGGVFVFWSYQDPTNSMAGIQAQALDADGNMVAGWGVDGEVTGPPDVIQAVRFGADGAYVIWQSYAISVQDGVLRFHIQRLIGGAVAPGWPVSGRLIGNGTSVEHASLAPDGAGGVYVGWEQRPMQSSISDLRLIRLGPDGEPAAGWPAGGLGLATRPPVWDLALAEDGAGGVYTAWSEPPEYPVEGLTRLHHFTPGGTPHPAWPAAGVAVGSVYLGKPLVMDGAGGLYVAWDNQPICVNKCTNCPCPTPLSATHLNANGAVVPGWTAAGTEFGDWGEVASDAAGGLLVGTTSYDWSANASADEGLPARAHATRVLPDGSPASGWSLSGNPVCSEPRQQRTPTLLADGAGGAFASWIDGRNFESTLYVSRLTPSGSVADGWPETGSIGSEAAVWPTGTRLVPGSPGEAIVVWIDYRSGSRQLYAEPVRPGPAGPPAPRVGLGFTVTDIRPNPARGAFWATVSLPEPGTATLELFDLAGRVLESRMLEGGRSGVVQMNVAGDLTPGVYWLRLRQGSMPSGMRTSVARVAVVR